MAKTAHRHKFKIAIEGAKELDKALESMGDDAATLIDKAVRAGGEIALASAKARAPVDTGTLQKNIDIFPVQRRAGRGGRKRRIVSGSVRIGPRRTKKGAADDAYYGTFQELGFEHYKNGPKVPARKYLRDAVDKNRKRIAEAMTKAFARLGR